MRKFIQLFCVVGLVLFLTACKDKNSYQYLITHPIELKKRMEICSSLSGAALGAEKQYCQVVADANAKFIALLLEQQLSAETFGIRVLNTQTAYVNAKSKVKQLTADLAKMKTDSNATADLKNLELELAAAKKDCDSKRLEVKVLLVVLGVSTPN